MKNHNYLNIPVFIFIGIMYFSNSVAYGQDIMEDALVSVSYSEKNEVKTITATVTDQDGLPIEELDLYFYVQRTFSLLPIGDVFNTTDENGMVIIESDLYNDFSMETVRNWGIPVVLDDMKEKRSLWAASANAPLILVIGTSVMILTMWIIFWYIIYELYKISKIKSLEL
jgi:hypothetical protein